MKTKQKTDYLVAFLATCSGDRFVKNNLDTVLYNNEANYRVKRTLLP